MPNLTFPLEEQNKYPGRISFQVLKTTGFGIDVGDVQVQQAQNSSDNASQSQISTDGNSIAQNFFSSLGNVGALASDIFGANLSQSVETLGEVVELYLPSGVQVQDGVQFDNVDFGIRGASAFTGAENVSDVVGRVMDPFGEINRLTDAMRASPNKSEMMNAAASAIAQRAGTVTGAVVSSALQTTTNPNTRAVFKQVPLREFTFSFKMLPQSQKEAQEIEKIIQFFREEIYPETYSALDTPVAYKFPNKFVTNISYDEKDVGITILPAYLRNMSTTYNGTSQSFYRDGRFSEIDLTLTLVESRTLSKQDIQNGVDQFGNTQNGFGTFDLLTELGNLAENAIQRFLRGLR